MEKKNVCNLLLFFIPPKIFIPAKRTEFVKCMYEINDNVTKSVENVIIKSH